MTAVEYYNKNGWAFCERIVFRNKSNAIDRFIKYLKKGSSILDAGCGSGRDAKTFLELGYSVLAFDGSKEMVKFATQNIGQPVLLLSYHEMEFKEGFDGIWTNASLVHTPPEELHDVIFRMARALKSKGYWYMTFKYGVGVQKNGEITNYLQTEESLKELLSQFPELKIEELWVLSGINSWNQPTDWLGCIVRKD